MRLRLLRLNVAKREGRSSEGPRLRLRYTLRCGTQCLTLLSILLLLLYISSVSTIQGELDIPGLSTVPGKRETSFASEQ